MPKYMTELNTINDDLSKELISKFKTLNYMLERMWNKGATLNEVISFVF